MLLGVGRVWLERPAYSSDQPDASKDPLVSPSFLDTPLSEEETSGRCLCCVCVGLGLCEKRRPDDVLSAACLGIRDRGRDNERPKPRLPPPNTHHLNMQ